MGSAGSSGRRKKADRKKDLQGILPSGVYPLETFYRYSGLNRERERFGRQHGVVLGRLRVGRRVFIRGDDGIRFIEEMAALTERLAIESEPKAAD